MSWSWLKIACAVFLLPVVQPFPVTPTSATGRLVPVFSDLSISEGDYLLTTVLQGIDACGGRFVWRSRHEFLNATAHVGPLILAAVDGPNSEEQLYLKSVPERQEIVLLHLSDEFLRTTDPSTYGPSMHHAFRQYYHEGLGDKAITYLSDATIKHPPSVAWMPLGLARLRALPTAFSLGLPDRSHLWSWMGSMEGKPERAEMLQAVEAHSRAADIQAMGFLRIFKWFAGGFSDGAASTGGPDAMDAMQYTMLMHQTQFVPVPAGNSPEQFRLWEALEAGCLPILLAQHLEPDGVLYPLKVLGFEVVALQSWRELPEKLLELAQDLADNPGVYAQKQRHNIRLWAHVRGAFSAAIAQVVCEAWSRTPFIR